MDVPVVGDIGATNLDWEEGTMLRVIPEHARPPYDPKGATLRDLREFKQKLVEAAAPPQVILTLPDLSLSGLRGIPYLEYATS